MTPDASVVIATRNRCKDVKRAVHSVLAQKGVIVECIIIDDASDDGTAGVLFSEFPEVRLVRQEMPRGYIECRNLGFELARAAFVFSLDDDAYFTGDSTVAEVLQQFSHTAEIAAVALPFIEPLALRSMSSLSTPFRVRPGAELGSFIGCAHALRVEAVRRVGNYRRYYVHQGEERDLAIRLLNAGYSIIAGQCSPVVHLVSAARDKHRVAYYGSRNLMLFNLLNLPAGAAVLRVFWDVVAIIRYRFAPMTSVVRMRGIAAGLRVAWERRKDRNPVSKNCYRRFRALPKHGAMDWDAELPAPCGR